MVVLTKVGDGFRNWEDVIPQEGHSINLLTFGLVICY